MNRRRFAAMTLGLLGGLPPACRAQEKAPSSKEQKSMKDKNAQAAGKRFDFGTTNKPREDGFVAVGPETTYEAARGYGWFPGKETLLARDRGENLDALRRDFIVGKESHTFRVGIAPGRYLLTVVSGDRAYGDHITVVCVGSKNFPVLRPALAEFATLTATVDVTGDTLDITFSTPSAAENNWVVNGLTLAPSPVAVAPTVSTASLAPAAPVSTWQEVAKWPDPTAELLTRFRKTAKDTPAATFTLTGLTRADYLKLIAAQVDFWKKHQNADGAIIDPYRKEEFQYSTPAFAHAGAILVARAGRKDLLEVAAKALDWSTQTLSERKAASGHEDFYAPLLAHAIPLLKPFVPAKRAARWEDDIRRFDPFKTYRAALGSNNWNLVAASGEARFQQMGFRPKTSTFVEESLGAQGRFFGTPYGLYLEGPMPYDHFPRIWVADMLAGNAYNGAHKAPLTEALRRASITSLFMQSPWGELPAGGRSAQHQWNEAEQCVTYEIYATQAWANKDVELAAIFKRAAHLALASMQRWVRPSGEMQIVKNWMDPAENFAYEGYSAHSQYNLLPTAMLAIAYEHAGATENVVEKPAPADLGGYVFALESLHKVFANVGGTYIELDTRGDHHYDATGLIRIQHRGISPQLGTSDSVLAKPSYRIPAGGPTTQTTGVGVSWQDADGTWKRLDAQALTRVTISDIAQSPERVSFTVRYEGILGAPTAIQEQYVVAANRVELTTKMEGYSGPLRYMWPVLADDGKRAANISIEDKKGEKTVVVTQDGGKTAQTYSPAGAVRVTIEPQKYANHNGWAQIVVAEYAPTSGITLVIAPRRK